MTEYSYASISHLVMVFLKNPIDKMQQLILNPAFPDQGIILGFYFPAAISTLLIAAWVLHRYVDTKQERKFSWVFFTMGGLLFFAAATLMGSYPVQSLFPFGFGIGKSNPYNDMDFLLRELYQMNAQGIAIILAIPFILVMLPAVVFTLATTGEVPMSFGKSPFEEQAYFGLGLLLIAVALIFAIRGRRTRSVALGLITGMAFCKLIMPAFNISLIMGLQILGPIIALMIMGMAGLAFTPRRRL